MLKKEIDLYIHFLIVSSSSFDILPGVFSLVLLSLFCFSPFSVSWNETEPFPSRGSFALWLLVPLPMTCFGQEMQGQGYEWNLGTDSSSSFLLDWSLMHRSTKSSSSTLDFANNSLKLPLLVKEWYWPFLSVWVQNYSLLVFLKTVQAIIKSPFKISSIPQYECVSCWDSDW